VGTQFRVSQVQGISIILDYSKELDNQTGYQKDYLSKIGKFKGNIKASGKNEKLKNA